MAVAVKPAKKIASAISVASLCLLLLFSGCAKKPNAPRVETIDGITYVHCSKAPLYPEKAVTFEEEFVFTWKGKNEEILIYQPSRYQVDKTGNVYMTDRSEQNIKVFDPNGQYLRTIGAKGSGPGEFEGIGSMALLPDGRLLVLDWRARRTAVFDLEGKFTSSYQWKTSHFDIYLTTDSSCATDENVYGEKRQLFVKTYDLSGNEVLSYGEFTPEEMKMLQSGGKMFFSISLPYSPHSIFAGDQARQWLYHCLNDKYVIEVYDREGKLFRKVDRPYEPVPFTSQDAEDYRSGFADYQNKVFAEMAKEVELPKVKTIADRLLVDDLGNLWVETNEEKTERGVKFTGYDIFNKDGFYEAKIWTDIRPGLFAAGKMYRLTEDKETGSYLLKRYRVIWK